MNPLDRYPRIRHYLYLAQWLITGVQTVLAAFFAFQHGAVEDWPRWFLASLAVAPVAWAYLGVTAQSNTPTQTSEDPR